MSTPIDHEKVLTKLAEVRSADGFQELCRNFDEERKKVGERALSTKSSSDAECLVLRRIHEELGKFHPATLLDDLMNKHRAAAKREAPKVPIK